MSHDNLNDFLNRLDSFSLGFSPFFKDVKSTSYPPHNIVSVSDNVLRLEMAVAGFKKTELSVTESRGTLTIAGEKEDSPAVSYLYKGIGSRGFIKTFKIAEMYEITDTKLVDGILSITFTRIEPEVPETRLITIE